MAIEAIQGKVRSEPLNRNFSYVDSEVHKKADKNKLPLNVKDFDAKGDGQADDSMSIQQTIDAAVQGEIPTVEMPEGDYYIASPIEIKPNIHLKMTPNTKIIVDNSLENGIVASGSEGFSSQISSDMSIRNTVVNIEDASGFQAGDLVMLRDAYKPANNQPQRGEMHYVREASEKQIILEEATWSEYKVSNNAEVVKINPVHNIRISGGVIQGGGADAEQAAAIDLLYAVGVVIDSTVIKNWYYRGIKLRSCMNGYISHSRFEDILSDTLGYAIKTANACQNVVIDKNTFIRCGKAYDLGGLSSEYGTSRFIWVQNNWVYGSFRDAISTHEGGEYIYIINNDCFSRRHSASIWVRTTNTEILNNRIWTPQEDGIKAENRGSDGFIVVKDNIITYPGRDGIRIDNYVHDTSGGNGRYSEIVIEGNILTGVSERGINVRNRHGEHGDGKLIQHIMIQDNLVRVQNTGGLDAIMVRAISGDVRDIVITGNKVEASYEAVGRNGIVLRGDGSYEVYNALVTGNHARGGTGIRAVGNNRDHWVDGNMTEGTVGFDESDLGENRDIS